MPWARGPGQQLGAPLRRWRPHLERQQRARHGAVRAAATACAAGSCCPTARSCCRSCDVPEYRRAFVLRSADGGRELGLGRVVAALPDRLVRGAGPAAAAAPAASCCCCARMQPEPCGGAWSDDGGLSWAEPEPTGIDGYPAPPALLPDGRLLCTYGFRRPPYAIRGVLSNDEGELDRARPIDIRAGLPNRDLGYPCTVSAGGGLISVYYARDATGCTAHPCHALAPVGAIGVRSGRSRCRRDTRRSRAARRVCRAVDSPGQPRPRSTAAAGRRGGSGRAAPPRAGSTISPASVAITSMSSPRWCGSSCGRRACDARRWPSGW